MARPFVEAETVLGQRLKEIREALGKTRAELSKYLGIKENILGRYERGIREPNTAILALYREHFRVNLNWLLTGEEEMFGVTEKALPKIDRLFLKEAIEAVDIGLKGRFIVASDKSRMISLAYEFLTENNTNTSASDNLGKILKLVSSK